MKTFIIAIFLSVSTFPVWSQYYMVINTDTTFLEKDSIILSVENRFDDILWQVSSDSINWVEINEPGISPSIWIDSIASYRAVSKQDNCPVVSDTILLGFEKVNVNNSFTINKAGIVYQLPSGTLFKVPANSVPSPINLDVIEYDSLQANEMLPFSTDSGKLFISSIDFKSEESTLLKPLSLRIPIYNLSVGDLPRIYQFDSQLGEWFSLPGTIICDLNKGLIEFPINRLGPIRIHAYPGVLLGDNSLPSNFKSQTFVEDYDLEPVDNKDPCYNLIKVSSSSSDEILVNGGTTCSFNSEEGSVSFPNCTDKPAESWLIREIGEECDPKYEITINDLEKKDLLKVGDNFNLTFFLFVQTSEDGKKPLTNQKVEVEVPFGVQIMEGSLKYTNDDGLVKFEMKANEENLSGIINYNIKYDYCFQYVEAAGGGINEKTCINEKRQNLFVEGIKRIVIYDDCTSPEAIDCSLSADPECQKIKNDLPTKIEINPSEKLLDFNERYPLAIKAGNVPSGEIDLISSDPSIADVKLSNDQWFVIAGDQPGIVTLIAKACDLEETINITVKDITCEKAKVTVTPLNLKIAEGGQKQIEINFEAAEDGKIYKPEISYQSSGQAATVTNTGIISAIKEGNTEILVKWCDQTTSVNVEVTKLNVCDSVDVTVNTNTINLNSDGNHRIKIICKELSLGGLLYVPKVRFTSFNNKVATVNEFGNVHGVSAGETEIMVEWCDKELNIPVSVTDNTLGNKYYRLTVKYNLQEEALNTRVSLGFKSNEMSLEHIKYFMWEIIYKENILTNTKVSLSTSSSYSESFFENYIAIGDCNHPKSWNTKLVLTTKKMICKTNILPNISYTRINRNEVEITSSFLFLRDDKYTRTSHLQHCNDIPRPDIFEVDTYSSYKQIILPFNILYSSDGKEFSRSGAFVFDNPLGWSLSILRPTHGVVYFDYKLEEIGSYQEE